MGCIPNMPSTQSIAKIDRYGRIVIPSAVREELGVKPGDEVVLRVGDGQLQIFTRALAIRRAQEIVRQYVPPGHSLSDELIADRRAEAERE